MTENKDHFNHSGKMLCPFCNATLEKCYVAEPGLYGDHLENTGMLRCLGEHCPTKTASFPAICWEKIIDGKRAQDALKRAKEIYYWEEDAGLHPFKTDIENFFDKEIATKQEK